jgi:hypothetical protein
MILCWAAESFAVLLAEPAVPKYFSDCAIVRFGIFGPLRVAFRDNEHPSR